MLNTRTWCVMRVALMVALLLLWCEQIKAAAAEGVSCATR